jgi:hypothetical protein
MYGLSEVLAHTFRPVVIIRPSNVLSQQDNPRWGLGNERNDVNCLSRSPHPKTGFLQSPSVRSRRWFV